MSKLNNEKPAMPSVPSAPPPSVYDEVSVQFMARAPPPSYEESQMMHTTNPQMHSQRLYQQHSPHQQHVANIQQMHAGSPYYPMPNAPYNNVNAYQWQPPPPVPPQQYQQGVAAVSGNSTTAQSSTKSKPEILTLAKGAKIRTTTTGAVSIPPPPPGCAPTPAQIAAMQGQPILVKKQKRSFF